MRDSDNSSVPTDHFDALYARSEDPWGYEEGAYERRKYARTLAALPRRHYQRGFELGCSIGVLTSLLARYCDHIVGADCSAKAIEIARRRHGCPAIDFVQLRAPAGLPTASKFDLIVLSEVLYFFSPPDLAEVARFVDGAASPGASILLVNYLGPTEHAASGDAAADGFLAAVTDRLRLTEQIREEHFRIDVLERSSGS